MPAPRSNPHSSLATQTFALLRPHLPRLLVAVLAGIVTGLSTAWLLGTLNRALHADAGQRGQILLGFGGLCLLVLSSEIVSAIGNSVVGQKAIADLRRAITEKVLCAPIDALQSFRAHRVLAVLHHDIDTVSAFTFNLSGVIVAFAMTTGCLVYVARLSPALFGVAALAIVIGLAVNYFAGMKWTRNYEKVRAAEDVLQKGYAALTEGAKELRMNRRRRLFVFQHEIGRSVDDIRDLKIGAMRAFWAARASGGALFFAAIGSIVAIGASLGTPPSVLSGFALALLYLKGPLEEVVGALPGLAEAAVAFRRIAELSERFATPETSSLLKPPLPAPPRFENIELRGVCYEFPSGAGAAPFQLGPLDLSIRAGETLFITGENGGGKTTLLLLLLGIYAPRSGEILLDGVAIDAASRDDYRQLFSAVFFDYALFDHRLEHSVDASVTRQYLERLQLSGKVDFVEGAPTTTDLSAGQRKRLALVQAYVEGRSILVFDEWAAEQDPEFRRAFYTEIVPDLKRQNKTLIVISHDDRYFHVADRQLVLRAGQIVAVENHSIASPALAEVRQPTSALGS